jgi:hypothetical protein
MSTESIAADITIPGTTVQIQAGSNNKTGRTLRVNFATPFTTTPIVVITPNWPTAGVGYAETVTGVDVNGFSVTANNLAPNYWINWIACSPTS